MISFNNISCILILLGLLSSPVNGLLSQSAYPDSYATEAKNQREEVLVFTDRCLYAVNEKIRFSSFCSKTGELSDESWSKVLYLELITPSGKSIVKGKFPHGKDGSSGYIEIPDHAVTGSYYLRAYTRWMRNFGPRLFCYVPITIINPFSSEKLDEGNGGQKIQPESYGIEENGLQINLPVLRFAPGEEVNLELQIPGSGETGPSAYCLTVVPGGLADTLYSHIKPGRQGGDMEFSFDYLPDIRGVSLSGTVLNEENSSPSPKTRMHFSLLGENPDYIAAFSDEKGRFTVSLPSRNGIQELFVSAEGDQNTRHKILIDQDFTVEALPFSTDPFVLTLNKRVSARNMIMNMQFSRIYSQADNNQKVKDTLAAIPFYGKPTSVIEISKYVDLPTMMEIFENLVPDALFYFRKGDPGLKFLNSNTNTSIYPPLILVDNIPVSDLNAVLSIDPMKIERIELINELYVKGNMMFGGIVSIVSRAGDMAAIDLQEGSYFFDYQCFYPPDKPGTAQEVSTLDKIPDTRNTLVWIDKIPLKPGESRQVKFKAGSVPGDYIIMVRGLNSRGEALSVQRRISVEE